jgi:hypothetical protein
MNASSKDKRITYTVYKYIQSSDDRPFTNYKQQRSDSNKYHNNQEIISVYLSMKFKPIKK